MVLVQKLIRIGFKPRLIFRTEIGIQENKRMGLETIFPSPFYVWNWNRNDFNLFLKIKLIVLYF
jgi:hypothetical protein